MRIAINDGLCDAHGVCSQIAPQYFGLDDDGYVVVVKEDIADAERNVVEEAILGCPVGALLLIEAR
jgi:ferredoxin